MIYNLINFLINFLIFKTFNVKSQILKAIGSVGLILGTMIPSFGQTNGASCGCPAVRTVVSFSTLTDANGNMLNANTVLTCDKTYTLHNKVYVGNGQTLTIAPGTIIKGAADTDPAPTTSNGGALTVSRGAKLFAAGTESCPIIFTAVADNVDGTFPITNKGLWGGVIVLGKATNNLTTSNILIAPGGINGVGRIEGFASPEPRIYYGAGDASFPTFDDNDNSGVMTYVSIRHGGEVIGANNEINGLTLGSVGRGTTLHHIEVVSNLDDGIEFFGGTVDLKYATVLFNDDDGFDWDQNWSGRGQFWVHIKTDMTTAAGGDNGFESDGDDDKINSANQSNPVVYNSTLIGSIGQNGNPAPSAGSVHGAAIRAKEQTLGTARNSVFANYGRGLRLDDDNTRPGSIDAYDNWVAGTLKVECNTFVGVITPLLQGSTAITTGPDFTKFTVTDQNVIVASLVGFDPALELNAGRTATTKTMDLIPTSNVATTCPVAPIAGAFFTPANYRGAFESGKKSWLSNYTVNALLDFENGLVPCATDANADGSTNASDLNLLLGQFGIGCD